MPHMALRPSSYMLMLVVVVVVMASVIPWTRADTPVPIPLPHKPATLDTNNATSNAAYSSGWPAYVRGKGQYLWASSRTQREDGLVYMGSNARLRNVMHRMLAGQPIRITAVGASITYGHRQMDGLPWPQYVVNYLADQFGPQIQGTNGAAAGTRTSYMAVCSEQHVPKDTDIVLMEYAVNDGSSQYISEELKRAEERLVRRMLSYPKKPAVLMAHTFSWNKPTIENWEGTAEPALNELAYWYKLPAVSLRACCFNDLLVQPPAPGFNSTGFRIRERPGDAFFVDDFHIDGLTGARVLAELVMHAMEQTIQGLKARPLDGTDEAAAVRDLPTPMHAGNYEDKADKCYVADSLRHIVTSRDEPGTGFAWVDELKGNRSRFGYLATQPGATLRFKLDTTATSLTKDQHVTVMLAFLKSYEHMGEANVTCVAGCTCQPSLVQGHNEERNSQTHLLKFHVSQTKECEIQLTVTHGTQSGQHKVKITGLIVSEEGGPEGYGAQPFFGDVNHKFDEGQN